MNSKDIQNIHVIYLIKQFCVSDVLHNMHLASFVYSYYDSYVLPNPEPMFSSSNNHISLDNLNSSVNVVINRQNSSQSLSLQTTVTSTTQDCRSRYAKFVYEKCLLTVIINQKRHVGRRDREPSRIPGKKLSRLLKKNRNIRKLVRKYIKKNVPRSSHIHRLVYAFTHERKRLMSDQVRYLPQINKRVKCVQERRSRKQTAVPKTSLHFKVKYSKKFTKSSDQNKSEAFTFKNLNHIINCCKFNLSRDIEKNPGPTFIDPSKTIHAPYCQGNVDVFGPNAGQQCVAMSLCSLIYNYSCN